MPNELPPNSGENQEVDRELVLHIEQIKAVRERAGISEELISDEVISQVVPLLRMVHKRHGTPGSETYKTQHNDEHALDVLGRFWEVWEFLREVAPEKTDDRGYVLGMFAAIGHDLFYDLDTKTGINERRSAKFVASYMKELGYGDSEIKRVYDAIITTTVKINSKGSVIQTHIRKGSGDMLNFALAMADINGIGMEGPRRMFADVLNLYMERNTHSSIKEYLAAPLGIMTLLKDQRQFLKDRLAAIRKDLAFYCSNEDEVNAIMEKIDERFSANTSAALAITKRFSQSPKEASDILRSLFSPRTVIELGKYSVGAAREQIVDRVFQAFKNNKN